MTIFQFKLQLKGEIDGIQIVQSCGRDIFNDSEYFREPYIYIYLDVVVLDDDATQNKHGILDGKCEILYLLYTIYACFKLCYLLLLYFAYAMCSCTHVWNWNVYRYGNFYCIFYS